MNLNKEVGNAYQNENGRLQYPKGYANGGDLFAYGGQIPQQLTEFNAGGSHESNEQGGILQGTGANGQPNLVEEGETKHEDYIFSDRLKVNPQISKDFKLPNGLNGKTFAQASKYLNREAKDRPNDPISNNAVKAHLAKLTAAQEGLKEQMQPQQQGVPMEGQPNANMLAQGQQFAYGGDQTHYSNPTLQGANIDAMGGNVFATPKGKTLGSMLTFKPDNNMVDIGYEQPTTKFEPFFGQRDAMIKNKESITGILDDGYRTANG
jgi:hypothetical protein